MFEDESEDELEEDLPEPPLPPAPKEPPIAPLPPEPPFARRARRRGDSVKNVTIRGIEADVYSEFSQQMKILGMTMGDAITKMMTDVLKDFDEVFPDLSAMSIRSKARPKGHIEHHDELSISARDLVEANAVMRFSHIGFLEIEPDVTRDLFVRYIRNISHCGQVRVPAVLPKLLVYSKVHFCKDIEIYDVKKPEEPAEDEQSE